MGQDHPNYASSLNNLAGLYRAQGKYDQALPLYEEALALRGRVLGQDHPNYAQSLNNLALLYDSQGKYDQALPLYEKALALIGRVLGQEHPDYAQSLNNLAALYDSQGKYDQALPLHEEALALRRRVWTMPSARLCTIRKGNTTKRCLCKPQPQQSGGFVRFAREIRPSAASV